MKNILLITASLYLLGCGTFDKESFESGANDSDIEYEVPATLPASEDEMMTILTGTDQLQWSGREFTLAGFLGVQECRLDDTMTLHQDGTYTYDGGKMSCGGDDVLTRSGTYRLDFEDKVLIFDENTDDEVVARLQGAAEGVLSLSGEVMIFGEPLAISGVYTVNAE